jgi:site-specific DNA-methyltransferase (cytosine-N4-specific)
MTLLSDPLYTTHYGAAYVEDALAFLQRLPDESIDLVLTSPPFALQRQKAYGNLDQDTYVEWLLSFAVEIKRVIKSTDSFVLDLEGAYRRSRPVRSLYNYRILTKPPSPIEWINKRKIRTKDFETK